MVLERNVTSDSYYFDGDRSVSKMLDETYAQAITINQAFWSEADTDLRFKIGDQNMLNNYYGNMPAAKRKQFSFNRILRVCNLVTGFQRRNRKSTITDPVEQDDDKASNQWSKLLFHTQKRANADEMISEAFEKGSVTTGMSLLHAYVDYSKDIESGDIQLDHVPYSSFLIDPYFKKRDLSDCNYIWRRKWMSKDAVKSVMPKAMQGFVDDLRPRGNKDGKFQYMAESYSYAMDSLLALDEYWYKDTREATFVVDPQYGLSKEWEGTKEQLKDFLSQYPTMQKVKTLVPTVKLIQCVEGQTVYNGKNPLGIDLYPFIPFLGYYEPDVSYFPLRCQGIVRQLRDPQFLYNRRKVIELDIMESQVNSGYLYKPSSLVNPRDIFMEGQGKGIALKEEASLDDIREIQAAQIPQSMIQLSELMGREIMEISGVNEELLGSATDDKAGVLSMLRQGAGLTTLQGLFDGLDFSQKLLGELFVKVIQKNYTYGKVARILGEEPIEEFSTGMFLDYDIRVAEGVNTTTQRQMEFQQLIYLKELGLPIPDKSIITAATVQNKEQIIEDMEQVSQEQQQAQQMQMQAQMQLLQAQIQDLQGKALANQGLGKERESRIQENSELSVERRAKAIEDISDAQLNRAKTLKELQDIDLTQIEKLLQLAEMLKSADRELDSAVEGASDPTTATGQKLPSFNVDNGINNLNPDYGNGGF